MERDTIRSLRRQMVQHNAAHPERPLTIKFLNNVPTLVDRVASRDQPSAATNRRGRGRSSVASVSMAAGVSHAPPVLPPPTLAPGGAFQLAVNGGGAISRRPTMVRQSPPNASSTGAATAQPRPPSVNGGAHLQDSHLDDHLGNHRDERHKDTN